MRGPQFPEAFGIDTHWQVSWLAAACRRIGTGGRRLGGASSRPLGDSDGRFFVACALHGSQLRVQLRLDTPSMEEPRRGPQLGRVRIPF